MHEFICEIKRQFRDIYKFPASGGTEHEPLFANGLIPDGSYPMEIVGEKHDIRILGGKIHIL